MPVRTPTPELIGKFIAAGVWQDRPLHAVVDAHARTRPDAPAIADQHERLSYAEFVRRSHALGRYFLDLGLAPGARVAVQSGNRLALALTHLACNRADLVFVPLSNAWRHKEIGHLLAVAEAEVLVVPQAEAGFDYLRMVADLRHELPALRHVGSLDGPALGANFDYDEVSRREVAPLAVDRDPNDARYVMVTSGTTELPRMSLWSDNNLWAFMQEFIRSIELGENDIAVGLSPANTGAVGYVFAVLGPLLAGAASVLLEEWSVENAFRLMVDEHATTATAVPTQVVKMLQSETVRDHDFSSLRVFTNAGAAMPPHTAAKMEEVFGCTGHVCYGASDGGSPIMTKLGDPAEFRHTTVGQVSALSEIRLVDALGEEVGAGQAGEICWRTPTKSHGYLNEPERTAAAWDEEGFYRSGDLGVLNEAGYLRIVGRSKDVIIRGGQNISPLEIEIAVSKHPAVAEVSVVGVPDPVYGERACACLVTRQNQPVTVAELAAFLLDQGMARYKLPERVALFDELPKSAGGKISKVELRHRVAAREPAEA